MWLLNVRKLGFDTALNFALGLPKHDLGWPPLRPLFRDNIMQDNLGRYRVNSRKKNLASRWGESTCCLVPGDAEDGVGVDSAPDHDRRALRPEMLDQIRRLKNKYLAAAINLYRVE